jgi:hypothetical protein
MKAAQMEKIRRAMGAIIGDRKFNRIMGNCECGRKATHGAWCSRCNRAIERCGL